MYIQCIYMYITLPLHGATAQIGRNLLRTPHAASWRGAAARGAPSLSLSYDEAILQYVFMCYI